MSTTKLGLGLAGMLSLAAVSSAFYEGRAARQAAAALAAAQQVHEADQAQVEQLTRQAEADNKKWSELQSAVEQMQAAAAAARHRQGPERAKVAAELKALRNAAVMASLVDGQAFQTAYPQARAMLTQLQVAQIAHNYGSFFRKAGLTAAQIDTFINQTSEQWLETLMVTPNTVHPAEAQLSDSQVQAILGPQGLQQFQDYQKLQPLVKIVNETAALAAAAPLTEAQSDQLLAVLANASSSAPNGDRLSAQSVNWDQALAQSQAFLSEPQIASLRAQSQMPQVFTLIGQYYQAKRAAKEP